MVYSTRAYSKVEENEVYSHVLLKNKVVVPVPVLVYVLTAFVVVAAELLEVLALNPERCV